MSKVRCSGTYVKQEDPGLTEPEFPNYQYPQVPERNHVFKKEWTGAREMAQQTGYKQSLLLERAWV